MDSLKIIEEKVNNVFKRKEVKFEMHFTKSPSKGEIAELIEKKFSSQKEMIVIDSIKGRFGSPSFLVSAKIYKSEQDKDKTEPKSKKDKKGEAPAQAA